MNTTNTTHQWNEDDSTIFLKLAEVFVPARTEQITTLLQLLPARMDEAFTMVELAAGEGILAPVEVALSKGKPYPRPEFIF